MGSAAGGAGEGDGEGEGEGLGEGDGDGDGDAFWVGAGPAEHGRMQWYSTRQPQGRVYYGKSVTAGLAMIQGPLR